MAKKKPQEMNKKFNELSFIWKKISGEFLHELEEG